MWIGTNGTWQKSLVKSCSIENCSTRRCPLRTSSRMLQSSLRTTRIRSSIQWCWNARQPGKHGVQSALQGNRPHVEPAASPFWTDPACPDAPSFAVVSQEDQVIAGLMTQQPGKLWSYITGHLKVIKTTTNENYLYKHQLMWGPKHNSWRLVFAFLPGSRAQARPLSSM